MLRIYLKRSGVSPRLSQGLRARTPWLLGASPWLRQRPCSGAGRHWRPGVCNTRFIKGHKPSNYICARIKSHVYTTEWTIYHSTYHVKRYNKANMNVIYYNNDKSLVQSMRKRKTYTRSSRKQGTTGTSTVRRTPRSPRSPGSAERTPSRWQELSSSRVSPRGKRVE